MTLRAVDRLLQILLGLTLLVAAGGVGFAVYMIGEDLALQGEEFDGLGTGVGSGILALVGIPAVLAVVALHRSLRGRPQAPAWAFVAAVVGIGSTLVFAAAYPPAAAALVPLVLVALVAVAARTSR
jgi:hypothetical protein